jgi:hypothetical protein
LATHQIIIANTNTTICTNISQNIRTIKLKKRVKEIMQLRNDKHKLAHKKNIDSSAELKERSWLQLFVELTVGSPFPGGPLPQHQEGLGTLRQSFPFFPHLLYLTPAQRKKSGKVCPPGANDTRK